MKWRAALVGFLSVLIVAGIAGYFWPRTAVTLTETRAEITGFTMKTVVRIVADGPDPETAVTLAVQELDRLTGLFDRFDPQGEIYRVNARGSEWGDVSPETMALVREALSLAALTEGSFDPTIAPLVDVWGFVETDAQQGSDAPTPMAGLVVPDDAAIAAALARVDYTRVEIQPERRRMRLGTDEQRLDLGGIAKGYGVDRAAAVLRDARVVRGLIDVGGDIFALGSRSDGTPWRLGIRHPRDTGAILGILHVRDEAVSTSGDYERYFEVDGTRYAHILDPRTGWPARDLISVTVVAPSGVVADALSTAVFVMGMERGIALIESMPGVEGVLVGQDFNVVVTSGAAGRFDLRAPEFTIHGR